MNKFMAIKVFATVIAATAMTLGTVAAAENPLIDSPFEHLDFGASFEAGFQGPIVSGEQVSYRQRTTLNVGWDLEKSFGLTDTQLFFQYQNHTGPNGSTIIGDIQRFDRLDDPEYDRLHMFWLQTKLMDNKIRLKLGKVDPLSEFFAPRNAAHHFGFSTVRSSTIIAQGPPSMSINAFLDVTSDFQVAFGMYDATFRQGQDENTFTLRDFFAAQEYAYFMEGRLQWQDGFLGLPGALKLGYWHLDGDTVRFDGGIESSTGGFYTTFDQDLSDNGVGVYVQVGLADGDVSPLDFHFGTGFKWQGINPSRAADVFGAGVSLASFSNDAAAPFIKPAETAYEIFYKAPLRDDIVLHGNLQAIDNPGGLLASDALVFSLRFQWFL